MQSYRLTTDLSATSLLSKHLAKVLIQCEKQQFFKDIDIQAVSLFAENDCCCAEQVHLMDRTI